MLQKTHSVGFPFFFFFMKGLTSLEFNDLCNGLRFFGEEEERGGVSIAV